MCGETWRSCACSPSATPGKDHKSHRHAQWKPDNWDRHMPARERRAGTCKHRRCALWRRHACSQLDRMSRTGSGRLGMMIRADEHRRHGERQGEKDQHGAPADAATSPPGPHRGTIPRSGPEQAGQPPRYYRRRRRAIVEPPPGTGGAAQSKRPLRRGDGASRVHQPSSDRVRFALKPRSRRPGSRGAWSGRTPP
jgi:hypothetical protein